MQHLKPGLNIDNDEVITSEECIDFLLFACIVFVKYKEKTEKRANIRIDKERLKESLMPSYDWILRNRLKTHGKLQRNQYKILGKWLKEFYGFNLCTKIY